MLGTVNILAKPPPYMLVMIKSFRKQTKSNRRTVSELALLFPDCDIKSLKVVEIPNFVQVHHPPGFFGGTYSSCSLLYAKISPIASTNRHNRIAAHRGFWKGSKGRCQLAIRNGAGTRHVIPDLTRYTERSKYV